MARPLKQGLDYFPLDVGFLQDMKVRRIIKSCGASAISVLIWLLGSCYRDEGYYIWWTEDLPFIVADEIGVTEGCVQEVVKRALQVGFFDASMKEKHGILTSAGIQKRFLEVTSRRKAAFLRRDFALISVNVDNNSINVCNNSINVYSNEQSKVKKSKVKKRKEKESKEKESKEKEEKKNVLSSQDEIIQSYFSSNPKLEKSIKRWMDMREEKKASVSPTALKKNLTQLKKLSNGNIEDAILIVEQSIENQWLGFWPLKRPKQKKAGGSYGHIASPEEWKGIKDGW